MTIVSEWAVGAAHGSLFVSGIPVSRGLLPPDAGLAVYGTNDADAIPCWWQARAFWPDGSVRWLMIHARLPESRGNGNNGAYRLAISDGATPRPVQHGSCEVVPDAPGSSVPGYPFPGFDVLVDGQSVARVGQRIDGTLPESEKPFDVTLVEDSPISPLFRVSNRNGKGVSTDWLIRIDPVTGSVYLTSRFSWYGEGLYRLDSIRLEFSAADGGNAPSRTTAILPEDTGTLDTARTAPGRVPPERGTLPEGQDLDARNGGWVLTVHDGQRRGPLRLVVADDGPGSFQVFVEPAGGMDVMGGTSFRHDFRLCRQHDRPLVQPAWPAGALVRTGVFGPVAELTSPRMEWLAPGLSLGITRLIDRAVSQSSSLAPPWTGLENDGDWPLAPGQYGSGQHAYADNEYDAAYACFLAHAATNRSDCLKLALRCSAHTADVDFVCTNGDLRYHGYGDEADDHRGGRVLHGDLGHYWTDGLWLAYFWTGDVFARESAEMLTRRVVSHFGTIAPADEFAICERNLGWPLMVAVSALETGTAPPETLEFCTRLVSYLDVYTADPDRHYMDPDAPVWWRCAMQDGCKPFMLGILNEALERMFRLTGDATARLVLGRIASYLMEWLYEPMRMDFEYEQNAYGPGHRNIGAQSLIPLFARGLLFTAIVNPAWPSGRQALASLHASAWCLFDEAGGKEFALMTRGILPSIALADELEAREARMYRQSLPVSTGQAANRQTFSSGDPVRFMEPGMFSDAADLRIRYRPLKISGDSLNRQAFFHACDTAPHRSSLSVIAFYNRLQVRFYDANGRLIGSLDAFVEPAFFEPDKTHFLEIRYQAPGRAYLRVDGDAVVDSDLDRPLSGSFRSVWTGRRPGNWSLNGSADVEASFGPACGAEDFPDGGREVDDDTR